MKKTLIDSLKRSKEISIKELFLLHQKRYLEINTMLNEIEELFKQTLKEPDCFIKFDDKKSDIDCAVFNIHSDLSRFTVLKITGEKISWWEPLDKELENKLLDFSKYYIRNYRYVRDFELGYDDSLKIESASDKVIYIKLGGFNAEGLILSEYKKELIKKSITFFAFYSYENGLLSSSQADKDYGEELLNTTFFPLDKLPGHIQIAVKKNRWETLYKNEFESLINKDYEPQIEDVSFNIISLFSYGLDVQQELSQILDIINILISISSVSTSNDITKKVSKKAAENYFLYNKLISTEERVLYEEINSLLKTELKVFYNIEDKIIVHYLSLLEKYIQKAELVLGQCNKKEIKVALERRIESLKHSVLLAYSVMNTLKIVTETYLNTMVRYEALIGSINNVSIIKEMPRTK